MTVTANKVSPTPLAAAYAELCKELADARLYILQADDADREWTKDESLAEWIHHFGKDMVAQATADLQRDKEMLLESLRECVASMHIAHSVKFSCLPKAEAAIRKATGGAE